MRICNTCLLAALAGIAVLASARSPAAKSGPVDCARACAATRLCKRRGPAPRLLPQANTDMREVRNYPEQPPVIPHTIEAYQLDANVNQCLSCHARSRTGESQAPMVSITHFMDRDGQFLASVSPRRYFCVQCHVPQSPGEATGRQSLRRCGYAAERSAEAQK